MGGKGSLGCCWKEVRAGPKACRLHGSGLNKHARGALLQAIVVVDMGNNAVRVVDPVTRSISTLLSEWRGLQGGARIGLSASLPAHLCFCWLALP